MAVEGDIRAHHPAEPYALDDEGELGLGLGTSVSTKNVHSARKRYSV